MKKFEALVKSDYARIGANDETKFYVKDNKDKPHSSWAIEDDELYEMGST